MFKENKDKIKNISLGAPYCMRFQLHIRSLRMPQVSMRLVAQAGWPCSGAAGHPETPVAPKARAQREQAAVGAPGFPCARRSAVQNGPCSLPGTPTPWQSRLKERRELRFSKETKVRLALNFGNLQEVKQLCLGCWHELTKARNPSAARRWGDPWASRAPHGLSMSREDQVCF